jgi:hypothetical protein
MIIDQNEVIINLVDLGNENWTFFVWQDVGLKQLAYHFLNGIRTSLSRIYSLCLIVFMEISSDMNSETFDWPNAPFTFCQLYEERTKSYEFKCRGVLLTYYGPALNSPNSCQCWYPASDRIRMRETILEMHRTDCCSFYALFTESHARNCFANYEYDSGNLMLIKVSVLQSRWKALQIYMTPGGISCMLSPSSS